MYDVLVIGGGNAALCAALMAREGGARVLLLEASPREWRGGNSQHTRNMRCMHEAPQDVLVDAYPEEEFWQDLLKVTGGDTNERLARLTIRASSNCRGWMHKHGVRFQPSLSGTLHLSRTNAFFMGGGKALLNAYYRSAEDLDVEIRYDSPADALELRDGRFVAAFCGGERIEAKACVLAAGGFESNLEWVREAWGQNERGEWPAENFLIRGTRFNQGVLLKFLMGQGADIIGDPSQSHCVAIDARAPLYDGGIVTRVDAVSLGVMLNREAVRFYDEGEDFWPKRYAIWGRLVAQQPGQLGYCIIDSKAIGRFMPPVFPPVQANTLPELARALVLDERDFHAHAQRLQRRVPARHLRPHGARRLPHRGAHAAQDALGEAARRAALLRLRAAAGNHLHLPGIEDERACGRALRQRAKRKPLRRRRDDGGQCARQGLHRRRGHEHRHCIRPDCRHGGGEGRHERPGTCSSLRR